MSFYRARIAGTAGAGGAGAGTAQIPREMWIVSVRAGGEDATPAPINLDEITLDVTIDGREKLTDNPTVSSTICGDGRQCVYLHQPIRVSNSIAVALVNNGAVAIGTFDVVFECVENTHL